MALRAVVFDYGMVLTESQEPQAYAALLRITGLERSQFEALYWLDRPAYDDGSLTGLAFWQSFLHRAAQPADDAKAAELNLWDARMWTTANPLMLAWQQQLKQRGLRTAILSNMGDFVHQSIEREFVWLHRFDVQVWSYQLRIVKPGAAIYQHTLAQLGTRPEETLFLDDKIENTRAAEALGIRAIQFSTVDALRRDLVAAGLDAELPLPFQEG